LQNFSTFPQDETRLHAIAIAQALPFDFGGSDVGDHANALLFDAERRDLGEATGLDHAHGAFQRLCAAPAVKSDAST
jgi:hypothetical protein